MPRRKKPIEQRRVKMNLTIHPEIREWANELSLKRRRSVSQLFEDLVEAEWMRLQAVLQPSPYIPAAQLPQSQPAYYQPQAFPQHLQPAPVSPTPAGH